MSSLAAQSGLLVATLDLQLVRLLRGAILVADLQSAADRHKSRVVVVKSAPPLKVDRLERVSVRHGAAPPYACHRGVERCCSAKLRPERLMPQSMEAPLVIEKKPDCESPLQPPWKTVPWLQHEEPAPKVKVVYYRPDIRHKGTLLDCFI